MTDKKSNMLANDKIGKLLFKMSMPATVGMLVGALYQIVDAIFIGQKLGALALGSMTITAPLSMFIMSIAVMFSAGTGSIVARLFGSKKLKQVNQTAFNSLILSAFFGIISTTIGYLFLDQILGLLGAKGQTFIFAKQYMIFTVAGFTFYTISLILNSLLRSEGNATMATVSMIAGTIINLSLDPILMFGFGMGMEGAAIATLTGQIISFLIAFTAVLFGKKTIYVFKKDELRIDIQLIKEIIKIGFPSFLRNFNESIVELIANSTVLLFGGSMMLATYGIINRIFMFTFLPMFGIVQGSQTIIGFNYGAKNFDRVKEVVKLSIKILLAYSIIVTTLLFVFSEHSFLLFTKDYQIIKLGIWPMRIIMLPTPLIVFSIMAAIYFQSIGKNKPALILSSLRQIGFTIPLMLILPRIFNLGINGVWFSYFISDGLSAIIAGIVLKKSLNKLTK